MIDYVDALSRAYPDVRFSCIGDPSVYENLVWEEGSPIPAVADIEISAVGIIKLHMWAHIKEERDRRKFSGVRVGDNWFHSDMSSRIQQLGLVMLGANIPAGLQWKTLAGTFVTMTQQLAVGIFQTTAGSDTSIFKVAEQHRAAMEASALPETYNFMSGWPIGYGE